VVGFASFPSLTVFDGKISDDRTRFEFYAERYVSTGMRSSELIDVDNYSMDLLSGIVVKK